MNGCRRHVWSRSKVDGAVVLGSCLECDKPYDPVASDRGRRNAERGQSAQARWMRKLGLQNDPSGPTDGLNAMFACSVKSGARFNESDWAEIEKQKRLHPDKVAFLLKVETPGRGRRARATVTLDVEDWIALHVADTD